MSRPRTRPAARRMGEIEQDETPQDAPLDPDALARELLRSIGSFGKDA